MGEQTRTPLQDEIWSALGNIGEFLGGLEGKDEAADEIETIIHREAEAASARIAALEGALEWALAHCRDSDHPYYPYFSDDAWRFPYLVNNDGGSGGGVGEARFDTALEAVQDAISRAALASTEAMKGE